MNRYIDANKLKEFWWRLEGGTKEAILDLIFKYDLEDCEAETMAFARELLDMVNNVIDTEPTADVEDAVYGEWNRGVK